MESSLGHRRCTLELCSDFRDRLLQPPAFDDVKMRSRSPVTALSRAGLTYYGSLT
jgi:hypothetical protein